MLFPTGFQFWKQEGEIFQRRERKFSKKEAIMELSSNCLLRSGMMQQYRGLPVLAGGNFLLGGGKNSYQTVENLMSANNMKGYMATMLSFREK